MGLFKGLQLGIEITPATVRVAGVSAGKTPRFIGCSEISLLQHEGPAVVSAIKKALSTAAPHRLAKGRATLLISEKEIFRKTIELPRIDNLSEQREAIRLEVSQYLPETHDDIEFDYQTLGFMPDGKSEQFMVVTVSSGLVRQYMEWAKQAGLTVSAVDTFPSAIGRAAVSPLEKKAVMLIQIEEQATVIALYRQGTVWVCSTMNQGLSSEEIEAGHLKRFCSNLLDEMDHLLKFYQNRTGGGKSSISEARLVGSGLYLPDLKQAIEEGLDVKISAAKSALVLPAFCGHAFYPVLGAALFSSQEHL